MKRTKKTSFKALTATLCGTLSLASCVAPASVVSTGAAPSNQVFTQSTVPPPSVPLDLSDVTDPEDRADFTDYARFNNLNEDTVFSEGAPFSNGSHSHSYQVLNCGGYIEKFACELSPKYRLQGNRVVLGICDPVVGFNGDCEPTPPPPTPKPTPKPTATPAPNDPSGGSSGGAGSNPGPGPTPRPKGVFWMSADRYFSPNEDGTKDLNSIYVHVDPSWGQWTLTVQGQASPIATGVGHHHRIEWDGAGLPDKEYVLVLGAKGAPSQTVKVILDTTPPPFEVLIDTQKVDKDDRLEAPTGGINPLFELKFHDEISGVRSKDSIETEFSLRPDSNIPKVYKEREQFEWNSPKNEGLFSYRVPIEYDSVLYPGTQTVKFGVEDRAGNRVDREIEFSVGDKTSTLFSGGLGPNDPRSTYRALIFPESEIYKHERQQKLEELRKRYPPPSYEIKEFDTNKFLTFLLTTTASTNAEKLRVSWLASELAAAPGRSIFSLGVRLFAVTAVTAGVADTVVLWSYADEEMQNLSQLIDSAGFQMRAKVDVGKVGDKRIGVVEINKDTWHHILVEEKHYEINPTILLDCLFRLKNGDAKLELWHNPDPSTKGGVVGIPGSVLADFLLLAKINGNIYHSIIHNVPNANKNYVRTSYIPRYSSTNKNPSLSSQWQYIATNVAEWYKLKPEGTKTEREQALEYYRSRDLIYDGQVLKNRVASAKFRIGNPYSEVEYPDWVFGQIPEDGSKTYAINTTQRRAIARDDRGL